jgi:hypothetical protein
MSNTSRSSQPATGQMPVTLGSANMNANPMIFGQRKQAVNDSKARIAIGPINASNLHQLLIVARIAQLHHAANELIGLDVDLNLFANFSDRDQILTQRLFNSGGHTFVGREFWSRMDTSHWPPTLIEP